MTKKRKDVYIYHCKWCKKEIKGKAENDSYAEYSNLNIVCNDCWKDYLDYKRKEDEVK